MNSRIDTEKTRKIVTMVMEKIKAEVDPWLLDEYHILFKKEVSLFHRSKVAAYLLMLVQQGKGPRSLEQDSQGPRNKATGRNGSARPERDGSRRAKVGNDRSHGSARGEGSDPQRYPLADKDSKWLFFSVGRSRRISPREILSLINTKTSLPKEDIGAIRIFDNYSFVQVRDTVAETIIGALTGYVFRGRPLTVNHAKSRKDGDEAGDENAGYGASSTDEPAVVDRAPDGEAAIAEAPGGDFPAATSPEPEASGDDSEQQGQDQPQEKDI